MARNATMKARRAAKRDRRSVEARERLIAGTKARIVADAVAAGRRLDEATAQREAEAAVDRVLRGGRA